MIDIHAPFVMPRQHQQPRASVLTLAQACELADLFEAQGIDSPYSSPAFGSPAYGLKAYDPRPHCDRAYAWEADDTLRAWCGGLPEFWRIDVADVLGVRAEARRRAALRASIEAFETTPAIRAHLLQAWARKERGLKAPQPIDMRWMIERARRETDQWHKPRGPLALDQACPLRLQLAKAVSFTSTQESYSDDSCTLVPVDGAAPDAEALKACQANLNAFVRRCDSHTGMAGSGSNWSASLIQNEHGLFVAIFARHSIAD